MTGPLKSWHCFVFLVVTAVLYWWIGGYVVFGAILGAVLAVWWHLTNRYPAMAFVNIL